MLLTLGQLADSTGLSVSTLRYYQDLELIQPILADGMARYGGEARLRLEIIVKGRQLGFSLKEIKNLIEARAQEAPSRRVAAYAHPEAAASLH